MEYVNDLRSHDRDVLEPAGRTLSTRKRPSLRAVNDVRLPDDLLLSQCDHFALEAH